MIITDLLVGPQCPLFDPAQGLGWADGSPPNPMARESQVDDTWVLTAGTGAQAMIDPELLSTVRRLIRRRWILQTDNDVLDVGILFKAGTAKTHNSVVVATATLS